MNAEQRQMFDEAMASAAAIPHRTEPVAVAKSFCTA